MDFFVYKGRPERIIPSDEQSMEKDVFYKYIGNVELAEVIIIFSYGNSESSSSTRLNARLRRICEAMNNVHKKIMKTSDPESFNENEYEYNKYAFVTYDYPGYCKSHGKFSQESLFESICIIFDKISREFPTKQILVWGRSIGCAASCHLANKIASNPSHFPKRPLGYILQSPMTSIFTIFIDADRLPWDRYENERLARETPDWGPTMLIHGTDDALVPFEHSMRLYDILVGEVGLISIDGGTHNSLFSTRRLHDLVCVIVKWILKLDGFQPTPAIGPDIDKSKWLVECTSNTYTNEHQ